MHGAHHPGAILVQSGSLVIHAPTKSFSLKPMWYGASKISDQAAMYPSLFFPKIFVVRWATLSNAANPQPKPTKEDQNRHQNTIEVGDAENAYGRRGSVAIAGKVATEKTIVERLGISACFSF